MKPLIWIGLFIFDNDIDKLFKNNVYNFWYIFTYLFLFQITWQLFDDIGSKNVSFFFK